MPGVSLRARVATLLAAGLVLVAAALWGVRVVTRPVPFALPPPPRPHVASSPPAGKPLAAPASRTPEKVEVRTLPPGTDVPGATDGLVTTVTITTPAFEIARRYRSMEGPYAEYDQRIEPGERELLWWKGARIEVLDETDKVIGQEFMCHLNIDVRPDTRASTLGLRPGSPRMLTLTQGELSFVLPKGRGVPVASDEVWSFMFQVLNHNRDGIFHVKERLTLYFVRDADLFTPVDATNWYAASIWVPVDRSTPEALALDQRVCHCCAPLQRSLEATNNVVSARTVDDAGRTLVGHWVVPPGKASWSSPISRYVPTSKSPRTLVATWTHVHPFATEVRLTAHEPGCAPKVVARSTVQSLRDGRVGLERIQSLAGREETLPADATFELSVDYDNTSGRPQDSMTSQGFFVTSDDWVRPAWASRAQNAEMDGSCGLAH
jgi:hypothetical protein